ncbi:hypothetical protein IU450_12805 [Nocardia abscessus]|uniref:hypothetical protein n=1 Tax=Nocardia abscessus TaxID=120957 RepID=UPI00189302BB|nr:hypothetical protein [Nocardia abscessus]MBF6336764.1 hypothetical protein [Nocardia abscessus]
MPSAENKPRYLDSERPAIRRWVPVVDPNPFTLDDLHIAARVLGFPDARTLVDSLLQLGALPERRETAAP